MNWLAHLFLSKPSIDFQLGNVIADAMKGKHWEGIKEETAAGMNMHQRIDAFTDRSKVFQKSKSRIQKPGHLKSVVIDLTYDHMLTKNWNRYSPVPLEDYLDSFYTQAAEAISHYPIEAKGFVRYLIQSNRLSQYSSLQGIEDTMVRLDQRLSARIREKDSTTSYLPYVIDEYENLERDFLEFFPTLQQHCALEGA